MAPRVASLRMPRRCAAGLMPAAFRVAMASGTPSWSRSSTAVRPASCSSSRGPNDLAPGVGVLGGEGGARECQLLLEMGDGRVYFVCGDGFCGGDVVLV